MSLRRVLLIFTICLVGVSTHAAELYEDYYSIRAVGMGDAYTAIADNEDMLFYNPAALCRTPGLSLVLADARVTASGLDLLQDVTSLTGGSTSQFAANLQKFYGQDVSADVGVRSAILVPCFEFSAWGGLNVAAKLDNPAYPTMYIRDFTDVGAGAGLALDLVPGFVSFGLGFRRINRLGAQLPIGIGTLGTLSSSTLSNQLAGSGVGYGVDGAINLSIPSPIRPTLSVVYKNAGYNTFVANSALPVPPPVRDELIIGTGFNVETPLVSIRPAFDFKHVTEQSEQLGKKIHVGIELALPVISARAGLYQGYYTAGLGINLGILHLDAATWGVELGEYPGQDESRRYGAELKLELSFDADMGLLGRLLGFSSDKAADGANGKKSGAFSASRHLKQRR